MRSRSLGRLRSHLKTKHPQQLWGSLLRFRTSALPRAVVSARNQVRGRAKVRAHCPYFPVEISGAMGMGAVLSTAIMVLHDAERRGLRPYFRFTTPNYAVAPGRDWLPTYFSQLVALPADLEPVQFHRVSSPYDITFRRLDRGLTLHLAAELFSRHLQFESSLVEEARTFREREFGEDDVIGVHYRGTDKHYEAPRVAWERVVRTVRAELAIRPRPVFLATDEPEFLDYFREALPGVDISDLACSEIYSGGRPAHFSPGNNDQKAREALLTMLVLAGCGTCIRTSSHLSAWAKILNPDQVVIMLSRPERRAFAFPDKEIWAIASDRDPPVAR